LCQLLTRTMMCQRNPSCHCTISRATQNKHFGILRVALEKKMASCQLLTRTMMCQRNPSHRCTIYMNYPYMSSKLFAAPNLHVQIAIVIHIERR
jgi:hypothetical protein